MSAPQTVPDLLAIPPSGMHEAAMRFAVIRAFSFERVPTLDELRTWSGLPALVLRRELSRWHPQLLEKIEQTHGAA